ncbi:hypothetical protein IY145_15120 [Methylosinus sp. H3A]|uniref:class I SAM-dependent methyltransferase n=1 Tax=Methylosinus sp. H3A TaxID=2785786 RepID=UPI0018C22604|nr:hypothetical protein [Methylosinus sp. H3A]MBG0810702.1 hypothetical protein [Methylosinus sp. H3A]
MLRKLRSKLPKRSPAEVFDSYVSSVPRLQNAVDAIGGWSYAFPPECGVSAGELEAHDDARIRWAIDCFGSLEGRSALELAPGEASHSFLLESAGARVDAIEPSRAGFIRCLIAKEVMRLSRTRFWLGDLEGFLRETDKTYDLVVACDALRRFADPLAGVALLARRADAVFIHSQIVQEDAAARAQSAGAATLTRRNLIETLHKAGFSDIREAENGHSSALSIFARK